MIGFFPLLKFPVLALYVADRFIGLCLLSFGLLTVAFAETLSAGDGLARAVCGFLAVFWTLRLVVAVFVFDVRPCLTNMLWRVGYHGTTSSSFFCPLSMRGRLAKE